MAWPMVEGDLRRVIGDGDAVPDAEVDLGEAGRGELAQDDLEDRPLPDRQQRLRDIARVLAKSAAESPGHD